MVFILKRVANRERGMLWDRQSVLRGKLWVNIATRSSQPVDDIRATKEDVLRAGYKTAV